ncbi:erythroblast NAD(P)(+)--arginine ADP-ribosyltransferase-like [Balearica regulorum gibbericeps]|uniref:erythroblast NAD(P)(+)--arginine ADP-ribosyltransferase-like n=1 Tax=Balearica regulorum gibbericeps TaxID=100784 RepID=UPI003F648CA2
MEHLVLGLVLLSRTLAAASPRHRRDLDPVKVLDMAPSSFDDQYQGCSHMMEEELQELNQTEFANNRVYARAWTYATTEWQRWKTRIRELPVLQPDHTVALMAYILDSNVFREFDVAVRVAGRSREEYLCAFHFKVLHFLLSEALRVLRDTQPQKCHHVYWGVDVRFTARHQQSIRFGKFTITSLRKDIAQRFGKHTFFSVETCYGVPVRNFSLFPTEEEVLIPPFEIFKVTNITHNRNRTIIQLRSQGASSTYNCEWVKEKRCKNQTCVFSAGRSIHGDPPNLWGFLLAAAALAAPTGS